MVASVKSKLTTFSAQLPDVLKRAYLLHLAEAHPEANLLPPIGSQERAQVYRWLLCAATNIWECVSRVFYTESFTTDPSQHQ